MFFILQFSFSSFFFFFNDTATTEIYTLSLHDALPILGFVEGDVRFLFVIEQLSAAVIRVHRDQHAAFGIDDTVTKRKDRKSTRLNSSHDQISYAVFCLKKKKKIYRTRVLQPTRLITRT